MEADQIAKDTDKGGNITVEEFARVMRKTSPSISDEEVSKIVSEVDLDGDGTINFDGKRSYSTAPICLAGSSVARCPAVDSIVRIMC